MSTTALALPSFEFGSLELVQRPVAAGRRRVLALVPARTTCPAPLAAPLTAPRRARCVRAARPCPARRPLRITRRGRLALTTAAATVLTGAVLVVAGAVGGPAGASAANGPTPRVVTVLPGQTLSEIATALAPGSDWREVAAEIAAANGLPDQSLRSGQQLTLPDLD